MSKITDLDKKIKDSIVEDRQKDYGDYQHNFTMLAEMFTLILFDSFWLPFFLRKSGLVHDLGDDFDEQNAGPKWIFEPLCHVPMLEVV